MNILDRAKETANEYARDIGGVWVVIGNPNHPPTKMRDLCITEANPNPFWMFLPGDAVLYSTAS